MTLNVRNNSVVGISPIERIVPYTWQEFLNRARSFHNYTAPGVLVGGIMISIAKEKIPEGVLFDVICETSSCLPDSAQLLTPCTIGNGWLKIINLGRFAVSLYDKHTGKGVRVFLDPEKLERWDEIQAWILKLKTKREQDSERLQKQIWLAGKDIYTLHPIQVKSSYLTKHSKGPIGICSICGEAFPVKDGSICLGCQGEAPYEATIK
jgi:formylmethanofuran dehydrogenase subunit E